MEIMTVRAPDRLRGMLKKKAEEQGQTRNGLILQILWEWVENKEEKARTPEGRDEVRRK